MRGFMVNIGRGKMGKLIIRYEHDNAEWYQHEEWELPNSKAHELFSFFTDVAWKLWRWNEDRKE